MTDKQQGGWQYPETNRGIGAMANDLNNGNLPHQAFHRCAYIRSVEKKLAEKRTALGLVKRKVDRAVASGRIARSDQLVNAERQADSCLLAVENWVTRLSADPDTDWGRLRFKTDIAMEELSNSVKQMVARFT